MFQANCLQGLAAQHLLDLAHLSGLMERLKPGKRELGRQHPQEENKAAIDELEKSLDADIARAMDEEGNGEDVTKGDGEEQTGEREQAQEKHRTEMYMDVNQITSKEEKRTSPPPDETSITSGSTHHKVSDAGIEGNNSVVDDSNKHSKDTACKPAEPSEETHCHGNQEEQTDKKTHSDAQTLRENNVLHRDSEVMSFPGEEESFKVALLQTSALKSLNTIFCCSKYAEMLLVPPVAPKKAKSPDLHGEKKQAPNDKEEKDKDFEDIGQVMAKIMKQLVQKAVIPSPIRRLVSVLELERAQNMLVKMAAEAPWEADLQQRKPAEGKVVQKNCQ